MQRQMSFQITLLIPLFCVHIMFRVSCFPSTFLHSHCKGKSVSEFKCKEKCSKGSESGVGVYEIYLLFQYECKLLLQRPYWMPSCHPRGQLCLTSDHQSILKHHKNFLNTRPKAKMLILCISLSERLHCAFFWGELRQLKSGLYLQH